MPGLVVELFFAITGYFLFAPDLAKVQGRIKGSIKKILPIILFLQIFYNLITPFEIGLPWESYWTWFQWVVLGFRTFDSGHLWYLTALLLGLIFMAGYLRVTRGRWMPWLFLLIIPWALIGPYRPVLFGHPESVFVFNFLTRAVPFLAMGYWIRANEEKLLSYRWLNIYPLLLALAGIELLLTYVLSGGKGSASIIAMFPLQFAAFMLFLSYKTLGQGSWLETIGKRYSGNIYYYHMAVIIGWKALNASSPTLAMIYEQGGAFVVFFISLAIAYLIEQVERLFAMLCQSKS